MNIDTPMLQSRIDLYKNFTPVYQAVIDNFFSVDVLLDDTKQASIMSIVYDTRKSDTIIGMFVCVEKEQNTWFVQYYGDNCDEMSRDKGLLTTISTFIADHKQQPQYFEQNIEQIKTTRMQELTNRQKSEMEQLIPRYQRRFNEDSRNLQQTEKKILNIHLTTEMKQEHDYIVQHYQEERNFFTKYPLFMHEEQKIIHDNFIHVIFQQSKITQIGRMSDRVFVQEYQHMSEFMKQQYVNFLQTNCGFNLDENVSENEKILIFFSMELNNMTGFQLIKYNYISGIAERYSSCTDLQYRGRGIMKRIDNTAVIYMQIKFPGLKYIWTGLKVFYKAKDDGSLDTELTKKEAMRKIRSGFGWDLQISKVTPLNSKFQFRFISFYWKPNSVFSRTQMFSAFDKVSKLIDDFPKTLYIPLSVIERLKVYRDTHNNQEYGGNGDRDRFSGEIPDLQLVALSTNVDSTLNGEPVVCDTPFTLHGNHLFSFHTHPDGCYEVYQQGIGWPSSADLHMVLRLATLNPDEGITLDRISTIHFVIAKEGIYSIRLSRKFVNYYKTMDDSTRQHVTNLIENTPNQVSSARISLDTLISKLNTIKGKNHCEDQDFMIIQALNQINSFKYNDIPVFKVTFERYENIMSDIKFTRY